MTHTNDAGPRLEDLHEDVWQRLARGVADRHAAARYPVLATVGLSGAAEARVVVLRGADRATGVLTIHTDAASGKVAEVQKVPDATLLVWDARAQRQFRLRCTVSSRPGTPEEWARVPDPSRRAYVCAPAPGTPIPRPDACTPGADATRFTVLEATLQEVEILHLGSERHLRAVFRKADGWRGQWLAP